MIRLGYEKSGQNDPGKAGHHSPAEEAQVDNAQVQDKVRRREYMRTYMRKRRDERAEMEAIAEDKIGDAAMMERLAQDYEYTAERMDGIGSVLGPAVEVYLSGGEMTSTELMALQAYLKRSITEPSWRPEGVEGLRERVEGLDTREKLKEWLGDAHELGIDPL